MHHTESLSGKKECACQACKSGNKFIPEKRLGTQLKEKVKENIYGREDGNSGQGNITFCVLAIDEAKE